MYESLLGYVLFLFLNKNKVKFHEVRFHFSVKNLFLVHLFQISNKQKTNMTMHRISFYTWVKIHKVKNFNAKTFPFTTFYTPPFIE